MAKKQYVNLNRDPAKPEEGALVELKADVSEDKPGDAKGQNGFFFIDPDTQGNLPLKLFPDNMRPEGYASQTKYSITAPIEDAKMQALARIGAGGGDQYKFKYGKLGDASDAKAYPGDPVQSWRKIFIRTGHMPGSAALDLGGLTADYDPVFVEFEQDGGGASLTHKPLAFEADAKNVIGEISIGKTPPVNSQQTVYIAMVDRLVEKKMIGPEIQVWPAKNVLGRIKDWLYKVSGGEMTLDLPKGQFTWPDDKDWLFTVRALLDKKGKGQDVRFFAAPEKFVFKDGRKGGWKAPEGLIVPRLKIDRDVMRKELITMMTDDTEKVTIEVKLWATGSVALGFAMGRAILVGTNDPFKGKPLPAAKVAKTLVHELGHVFGLVPHYLPEYSEDKAEAKPQVENPKWYDGKGGQGNHCGTGAKEVKGTIDGASAMVMEGGSCLMFHEGNDPRPFCSSCQTFLKRASLKNLGISNVWPKGWTK